MFGFTDEYMRIPYDKSKISEDDMPISASRNPYNGTIEIVYTDKSTGKETTAVLKH